MFLRSRVDPFNGDVFSAARQLVFADSQPKNTRSMVKAKSTQGIRVGQLVIEPGGAVISAAGHGDKCIRPLDQILKLAVTAPFHRERGEMDFTRRLVQYPAKSSHLGQLSLIALA